MAIDKKQAAGFKALNNALTKLYGTQETHYFSGANNASSEEIEPLEGISVYKSSREKQHWHYVTFGFSDLEDKESETPGVSGFGYELTFRLQATDSEKKPPAWPCRLLNEIARHVFELNPTLKTGWSLPLSKPIESRSNTLVHAVVLSPDGELDSVETVNGRVEFFQLVGLTLDELDLFKRIGSYKFLSAAKEKFGSLLITDLNRSSSSDHFESTQTKNGLQSLSTTSAVINAPSATWFFMTRAAVELPVSIAQQLKKSLTERLSNGLDLTIKGSDCQIIFREAAIPAFEILDSELIIAIPATAAKKLADSIDSKNSTHNLDSIPVTIEFA